MSPVDFFTLFVPRPWSRSQAEHAEKRLRQLVDAIWFVHGDAMAHVLFAVPGPTEPPIQRPARIRVFIARMVPKDWDGRQALRAVALLDVAIAAVWEVYSAEEQALAWASRVPTDSGDDIPF